MGNDNCLSGESEEEVDNKLSHDFDNWIDDWPLIGLKVQ
jgi:hypothetical protein